MSYLVKMQPLAAEMINERGPRHAMRFIVGILVLIMVGTITTTINVHRARMQSKHNNKDPNLHCKSQAHDTNSIVDQNQQQGALALSTGGHARDKTTIPLSFPLHDPIVVVGKDTSPANHLQWAKKQSYNSSTMAHRFIP